MRSRPDPQVGDLWGLTAEGVAQKTTRPAIARRINALVPDGRTEPSIAILLRMLRAVAAE